MNKDRCYSGQDSRSRAYDTKEARIGYWRCFDRWRGVPCPVCGQQVHAEGCRESEYPITVMP